jgi:enamine deaminase RidA (YjgF/YER057c/UK114 family)
MNEHSKKEPVGERISVSSGSPYESIIGFARAVCVGNIVAGGGTTAASGGEMVSVGDPAAQTCAILETIGKVQDAGARLEDVIRTRIYLVDIAHWEVVACIVKYLATFDRRPVSRFINPEWLVVIDADAVASSAGG